MSPLASPEASNATGSDHVYVRVRSLKTSAGSARAVGDGSEVLLVGHAVFQGEASEFVLNPLGVVHGGLALTLVDSATGCAVQTMLPVGVGYTTLETKANFVRQIRTDSGTLRAIGRAVHVGRSTATADARIEDASGRLYAHGTSTLLILGQPPEDAP